MELVYTAHAYKASSIRSGMSIMELAYTAGCIQWNQSSFYNRDRQARTRLPFAMRPRPSNKMSILMSYHKKFNDIVFIAYVKLRRRCYFFRVAVSLNIS